MLDQRGIETLKPCLDPEIIGALRIYKGKCKGVMLEFPTVFLLYCEPKWMFDEK